MHNTHHLPFVPDIAMIYSWVLVYDASLIHPTKERNPPFLSLSIDERVVYSESGFTEF